VPDEPRAIDVLGELTARAVVGEGTSERLERDIASRLGWWHRHLFERMGEANPYGDVREPGEAGVLRGAYRAVTPTPRIAKKAPAPTVAVPREALAKRAGEPVDRSLPLPARNAGSSRAGRMRLGRPTSTSAPTVRRIVKPEPDGQTPPPPQARRELPKQDVGLDDLFGFSEGGRFKGE